MRTFKATISAGEETLVDGVTVYLEEVTEPSGLRSWYGAFQLARDQYIEPGGPYRLKLDDKRSGDILVTNTTVSSYAPMQVSFHGTGPLA
jgi:hypothetical protein